MREVYNKEFKEKYYIKVLDNGLFVLLFKKEKFYNNFFTLITPYGASDYSQIDDKGNEYLLPAGVAHFLEHRLFDYKGDDVLMKFSELGSSANASTSHDQTQYYFSTTSKDFSESLNLLLDFVFDLEIPPETVKKEKGIIIEELNMYDNMVDFRLYFSTIKNLYHNLPYREDIGGSIESVSNTTLEDLNLAYKLNYHPSKMFLIGATNNNIEDVFKLIEDNLKDKVFDEPISLKRNYKDEPESVRVEFEKISMAINKSKVGVGYKFKHNQKDVLKIKQIENLLSIFFELLFTAVNDDYQEFLDSKKLNDYFDIDVSVDEDFGHCIVSAESENSSEVVSFVEDIILNYKDYTNESKFNQVKKKLLGKMVLALEQPSSIALIYGRNKAYGVDIFESLNDLSKLEYSDLMNLVDNLDLLKYQSILEIKKQ